MRMSKRAIFEDYQASREPGADRSVCCHAPFVSLHFAQSRPVTACCCNRASVLESYLPLSVRPLEPKQVPGPNTHPGLAGTPASKEDDLRRWTEHAHRIQMYESLAEVRERELERVLEHQSFPPDDRGRWDEPALGAV